jgi:hypothetical protein
MVVKRGTSNGNRRGGSKDRAIRRQWLVTTFGDGHLCHCYRCDLVLTVDTVSPDRIVLGADGGTYRRDNIRPACGTCQSVTGGQAGAARANANRAARIRGKATTRG